MEKAFTAHDKTLGLTQSVTSETFRRLGEVTPVEEVRRAINTVMMDPKATVVELYYSGHGRTLTGDWCFEDRSGQITDHITFKDILAMWRTARSRHPRKIKLYLICDCCYSGAWVEEAARLGDPTVVVRASCGETQLSWDTPSGGAFTKELLRLTYDSPRPTLSLSVNTGLRDMFSGRSLRTEEPQTPCLYMCG